MAVRSVRYGGGVWRQMEETRVALEQRLVALSEDLAERSRQLLGVSIARDIAVRRISELEQRVDERERRSAEVERRLEAEKLSAQQLQSEVLSWRDNCAELEAVRVEAEAVMEVQRASLSAQELELERSQLQITEAEQELKRLTNMLYDSQERVELLEQRGVEQDRTLRVLQGSTQSKTRQISVLTKDKHELARKLAQLRGGGGGCRLAAVASVEQSPGEPQATSPEAKPVKAIVHAARHVSQETGALEAAPIARMLHRTRERLAQEQQRNVALEGRVKELELDRRALVQRFREASAARKRAERVLHPASSSCA